MTYTDEQWEYITGDTWFHDKYYDLMCSILKDKDDNWIENFTLTDCEMREIFKKIEGYWIHKVEILLLERDLNNRHLNLMLDAYGIDALIKLIDYDMQWREEE